MFEMPEKEEVAYSWIRHLAANIAQLGLLIEIKQSNNCCTCRVSHKPREGHGRQIWDFLCAAPWRLHVHGARVCARSAQGAPHAQEERDSGRLLLRSGTILFGNPWRERFCTTSPSARRTLFHWEVKRGVYSTRAEV